MNEKLQKTLTAFLATATLLLLVSIVGAVVLVKNVIDEGSLEENTITMSAEAKVAAKPDTASISFSVVTQSRTAKDTQSENDRKMSEVLGFIKEQGVADEEIKTSNYNLFPRHNFRLPEDDPSRIVGYTLNQNVTVTVKDLDRVSALVGGLTEAGANQIESVRFFIDDTDELKAQAREMAVKKANDKAESLAKQLDVKLGEVKSFFESDNSFPGPIPLARESSAIEFGGGADASAPIESGTQDITVSVTITYEID